MNTPAQLDEPVRCRLLAHQKAEITEYHIYTRLAARLKSPENRRVLERIAAD